MKRPRPTNAATLSRSSFMIEIGTGEPLDTISVLESRAKRFADPAMRADVRHRLDLPFKDQAGHALDADAGVDLQRDVKAIDLLTGTAVVEQKSYGGGGAVEPF